MTNADKFASIGAGGYYSLVTSQPGKTIKYTMGTACWDGDDIVASIATCRANGWLVHNANGNEITVSGYSYQTTANVGNTAFQNDLKQRILNFLALHPGVDGVYFDLFGADACNYSNVPYPIYDQSNHVLWSNAGDFQNAQISFISNVGAALKAAGYLVGVLARGYVCGAGEANDTGQTTIQWMDRYAPYVTASMVEFWNQSAGTDAVNLSGSEWYNHWDGWQSVEAHAYADGIQFWPQSYIHATSLSQCRYLRGSFLLEWNGTGQIMLTPWSNSEDIWNSCTAVDLGFPSGAKYQVASGVWRRDFTRGYVIVNPTKSTVTVGSSTIPSGDAVLHQN
jgi:hypothetical protein